MAYVIDVRARSSAAPHEVFALLADGRQWLDWGVWTDVVLETPGAPTPQGPGAVRSFTSHVLGRTVVSRERVLELVPDRLLGYELLDGLPLRDYRARVELTPDGAGTLVRWHAEFRGARRGTGWLYRLVLGGFLADTAARLATAAQRPVAA